MKNFIFIVAFILVCYCQPKHDKNKRFPDIIPRFKIDQYQGIWYEQFVVTSDESYKSHCVILHHHNSTEDRMITFSNLRKITKEDSVFYHK